MIPADLTINGASVIVDEQVAAPWLDGVPGKTPQAWPDIAHQPFASPLSFSFSAQVVEEVMTARALYTV